MSHTPLSGGEKNARLGRRNFSAQTCEWRGNEGFEEGLWRLNTDLGSFG